MMVMAKNIFFPLLDTIYNDWILNVDWVNLNSGNKRCKVCIFFPKDMLIPKSYLRSYSLHTETSRLKILLTLPPIYLLLQLQWSFQLR